LICLDSFFSESLTTQYKNKFGLNNLYSYICHFFNPVIDPYNEITNHINKERRNYFYHYINRTIRIFFSYLLNFIIMTLFDDGQTHNFINQTIMVTSNIITNTTTVDGKIIRQGMLLNKNIEAINISGLNSGLYYLNIFSNKVMIKHKIIVKQ